HCVAAEAFTLNRAAASAVRTRALFFMGASFNGRVTRPQTRSTHRQDLADWQLRLYQPHGCHISENIRFLPQGHEKIFRQRENTDRVCTETGRYWGTPARGPCRPIDRLSANFPQRSIVHRGFIYCALSPTSCIASPATFGICTCEPWCGTSGQKRPLQQ